MGKYFANETLDALWARLVAKVIDLTGESLDNEGAIELHDRLINYAGLSRSNTPATLGDYLVGIANITRYLTTGSMTGEALNLSAIVSALENYKANPEEDENGFILNPDGSYTLNTIQYEAGTSRIIIPGEYNGAPVTKITATNLQGNTDIKAITIGEGVVEIDKAVFMNCNNVEELTLPQSLEKVGASAFTDLLYVTTLNISANLTSIGAGAFAGMERLTSITVDEANPIYYSKGNCLITKNPVNRTLVLGCNTSVIPQEDNIQIIGNNAFEDCKHGLIELRIPSTVHTIGSYAFDDCEGIVWMTIPASVKIQAYAFKGCTGLTNIYYEGASIDEWNQNVQIYVEKDHNSNHLLLRVKKACQGDWEWTSEGTPVITNSSAKAFLFTVVCNDDAYLDAPTENLKLGTTEFWEWWKNYFQYGIELNKRYYIDNTIFTTAVTNEGHVFAPEGTSIIAADGQQYIIHDGGPSPSLWNNDYSHHPNSVTFYAVTGALEQLTPLSYEVDGTQDTFVYNPNDVAVNVVYQYKDRSKSEIIDANANSSSVLAIVDDFIITYEENVTYSIMATISADGYETRTDALKVYYDGGTWYKGEVPTTKQLEPLVFISDFPVASVWENHNGVDVTAIMYIDGIEVARRMIEAYVSEDMVYEVAWMTNPGDYVENPETGRTYAVSVIATADGYLDSEAVTCKMHYNADSNEWFEGEAPGGGDTPTKGELYRIFTESELNGVSESFLQAGKGYFVEDVYFVAQEQGIYVAPPHGTVIDNGRNRGTVWWDGSSWGVYDWDNGPDSTPVIFYKVIGEEYENTGDEQSFLPLSLALINNSDGSLSNGFVRVYNPNSIAVCLYEYDSGSGPAGIEQRIEPGDYYDFRIGQYWDTVGETEYTLIVYVHQYDSNGEPSGLSQTSSISFQNNDVKWSALKGDIKAIATLYKYNNDTTACFGSAATIQEKLGFEPGFEYYLENTLFVAINDQSQEGYVAPPIGTQFEGTDGRIYYVSGHTGGNGITFERLDGGTIEIDNCTFYQTR